MMTPWPKSPNITANKKGKVMTVKGAKSKRKKKRLKYINIYCCLFLHQCKTLSNMSKLNNKKTNFKKSKNKIQSGYVKLNSTHL